jgi:hypothetical protein
VRPRRRLTGAEAAVVIVIVIVISTAAIAGAGLTVDNSLRAVAGAGTAPAATILLAPGPPRPCLAPTLHAPAGQAGAD